MTAGQLRHRVSWFRPVRARKEGGQATTTYELAGTTWAAVEPADRGGAAEAHDQTAFLRSHVVTVRDGSQPVEADWLAVWNGCNLNVVRVDRERPDANARWLVISCLELAPVTA